MYDPGEDPTPYNWTVPAIPSGVDSEKTLEPFRDEDTGDLRAAGMVAAVANTLNTPWRKRTGDRREEVGPTSREELRHAFFTYFDRDTLAQHWQDVDAGFEDALDRAVELELANRVESPEPDKYGDKYIGGFTES